MRNALYTFVATETYAMMIECGRVKVESIEVSTGGGIFRTRKRGAVQTVPEYFMRTQL